MALLRCPECGKRVSDAAVACPNCGYPVRQDGSILAPRLPNPSRSRAALGIGCVGRVIKLFATAVAAVALLGAILVGLARLLSPPQGGSPPAGAPSDTPRKRTDGKFVAKGDCWAAVSPEKLNQFTRMAIAKDYLAMQRMENDGDVIPIPQGEEVFDEHGGFSAGAGGYKVVRRKGETRSLYVVKEFLDDAAR